jgi:uncharacterized protein
MNYQNSIAGRGLVRAGITFGLAALIAACGSSGGVDGSAAAQNSTTTAAASSPWTTLGTRQVTSTAERSNSINAAVASTWTDYNPASLYPKTVQEAMQYITMPDGTKLATYVTLPADSSGKAVSGSFPTILIQTSYNGVSGEFVPALGGADSYMVEHGYATVVVDVRGTGQSEGEWEAFGATEQADYGHVVDWVTQQAFCNGTIGVYGVSYLGITAIITAAQDHPAVKAAFPIVPIGDGYRDIVFTGGQINPTFIPFWLGLVSVLGLTDPTILTNPQVGITAVLEHILSAIATFQVPIILDAFLGESDTAYDNGFWATRSPLENDAKINVPTFIVGGLHDLFQRSEPISYEEIKPNAPAKLLIGPWTHLEAALGQGLPADGVPVLDHIELQWFDQYLKGMSVGADTLPNVTQYVSGYGHYVTASDWPNPQASAQRLYFHADKSLSTDTPAPTEGSNTMLQTPIEGLCSISSSQWTAGILGYIPLPCFSDDNLTESWDVVYQTPVMSQDYYFNGPIEADVWMSTTDADSGLSVRVDDVDASGTAVALTNGIQTASLRMVDTTRSRTLNGQMIQPWHPYTPASVQAVGANNIVMVPVEIFQTSAMIAKGHRLRIAVGASDLPQGVPPIPTLLQSLAGLLTIYSDAAHPSSVVLPVVPVSALPNG